MELPGEEGLGVKRFVAFLRAINVGGHIVKMDRLRALFESMGLENVETFIASGNVIFESGARNAAGLEEKIARQLEEALGYEVATFLRTAAELGDIASYEPFPGAKDASLYIGFLARPLTKEGERAVMAFRTDTDDFHLHGREIYWSCTTRSTDAEFSPARFERTPGVGATCRNSTTVRKMALMYGV